MVFHVKAKFSRQDRTSSNIVFSSTRNYSSNTRFHCNNIGGTWRLI
jgi:hypothetical protein